MINDYVGYWKLDEDSGNVFDSSGNGYTGTNNGSTSVLGKRFFARDFASASSQYITMGNVLDFTTNNFSIAFWFKSSSGTSGYLVGKHTVASGYYLVYFNGFGSLALYLQTDGSNWKQTTYTTNLADGTWHHCVGTRTGASNPTLALYTDGVLRSTTDQSSGTVTTVTNVGSLTFSSLDSLYNGSLDDVRIYNRALSATEVNQIYEDPVLKLKFNNSGIRPRPFAPGLAK
jgi:hypothetical protein